jgi:hypothetical protein
VTNLPLVVLEPFGHVDLRDALGHALRTPDTMPAVPTLRPSPGREVFQYLGTIDRPRQLGFRDSAGSVLYDFRSQRFQLHGGPWLRPTELSGSDRDRFLRLIHYWERMMLA